MSTVFSKIVPFVALAAVVTCGTAASSTSAAARPYYYHPYAYHHSYGLQRYGYRRGYGGPAYARGPVYNHDDAHRLSRQTVGVGD